MYNPSYIISIFSFSKSKEINQTWDKSSIKWKISFLSTSNTNLSNSKLFNFNIILISIIKKKKKTIQLHLYLQYYAYNLIQLEIILKFPISYETIYKNLIIKSESRQKRSKNFLNNNYKFQKNIFATNPLIHPCHRNEEQKKEKNILS